VPDAPAQWLAGTDDQLILKHCGYWASLRGMPDTTNAATVSIPLLRENSFTVEALRRMMDRIEQGQLP